MSNLLRSLLDWLVGPDQVMHHQALRGELGPTAQEEARLWELASRLAQHYPVTPGQMRYLLGQLDQQGLGLGRSLPSQDPPGRSDYCEMARHDLFTGKWKP